MVTKNSKTVHLLSPPDDVCTKNHVHSKVSCSACHTAWAPQCVGCHNEFDKDADGFDLLDYKFVKGEWVEYVGKFFADLPTIGKRKGENGQFEPAVPGMIMTIDKESFYSSDDSKSSDESLIFHRLYAPVSPHTTSKKGRSCKSCHNNSLALGYGRGELKYVIEYQKGHWEFTPEFANRKEDGLPEDAWVGFDLYSSDLISNPLDEYIRSTRTDFRPLSIEEQKKVLLVGACLHCHDENSEIIIRSLDKPFEAYLKQTSVQCVLPE
jgi:hypothetical protein